MPRTHTNAQGIGPVFLRFSSRHPSRTALTGLPLSSSPSRIPRRRLTLDLALTAALCTAAPAVGADPILPLSGVQAGMTGTAYTVVHGTDITTFPVTILDVVGPGVLADDSLILARAQGPLMTETGGVAEGMSGSPVYVTGADGVARVIGAIAYGTADEASTLIGITPIENMLNAALQGVGLIKYLDVCVREHLADGRLVRVLEPWCRPFSGFYLYVPSRAQMPAKTRALMDFLVERRELLAPRSG